MKSTTTMPKSWIPSARCAAWNVRKRVASFVSKSTRNFNGAVPITLGWSCLLFCGCTSENDVPQSFTREQAIVVSPQSESEPTARERPVGLVPHFRDIADESGVIFQRFDDISKLHRIIEGNGGGVALIDFDADGWLDIFFTDGCRLPRKIADTEHSNQMFQNDGTGRFRPVTRQAMSPWHGYCHGCAVGDYDNDGFEDLYVTAFGKNRLWHNRGDGTFRDASELLGSDADVWSSSAAFGDLNRDGNLDLYVANYVQTTDDPPELCPVPNSPDGVVACPPTVFHAEDDVLFVSNGDGTFRDATRDASVNGSDGKGLGVLIFDANQDGWPDVYVANDGMPNFLYLNDTSKLATQDGIVTPSFRDVGAQFGVAVNELGTAESSMGIAHGDADGDGWTDLLTTNFLSETNTFYRNLAGQGFADETRGSGLGAPSRQSLGFGTEFLDFDNDGWLDLFVAAGHIDDLRWNSVTSLYAMPPQFYRNERGGRFIEVSPWAGEYFGGEWLGRGVAKGDIDNDGNVDLVVSHQLSPSAVLRNETTGAHKSVVLKLIGRRSNRSGIGVRVEVDGMEFPIMREVVGGGSYQSASELRVHLGLGHHETAETVRILWPAGTVNELENVAAGQYLVIEGNNLPPIRIVH